MQDYLSIVKSKIPYNIEMSLTEYIEFQLRLIFGKDVINFSKGELQVLSYLYIYPNTVECITKIIESRLRNSKKSVLNDISKFKGLDILEVVEGNIKFNDNIIVYQTPNIFEIKVNLNL